MPRHMDVSSFWDDLIQLDFPVLLKFQTYICILGTDCKIVSSPHALLTVTNESVIFPISQMSLDPHLRIDYLCNTKLWVFLRWPLSCSLAISSFWNLVWSLYQRLEKSWSRHIRIASLKYNWRKILIMIYSVCRSQAWASARKARTLTHPSVLCMHPFFTHLTSIVSHL